MCPNRLSAKWTRTPRTQDIRSPFTVPIPQRQLHYITLLSILRWAKQPGNKHSTDGVRINRHYISARPRTINVYSYRTCTAYSSKNYQYWRIDMISSNVLALFFILDLQYPCYRFFYGFVSSTPFPPLINGDGNNNLFVERKSRFRSRSVKSTPGCYMFLGRCWSQFWWPTHKLLFCVVFFRRGNYLRLQWLQEASGRQNTNL